MASDVNHRGRSAPPPSRRLTRVTAPEADGESERLFMLMPVICLRSTAAPVGVWLRTAQLATNEFCTWVHAWVRLHHSGCRRRFHTAPEKGTVRTFRADPGCRGA